MQLASGQYSPRLSVTFAYVLTMVRALTVVGYLAHLAQKIRAESMLRAVTAKQDLNDVERSRLKRCAHLVETA